jgi:hypothetical protein
MMTLLLAQATRERRKKKDLSLSLYSCVQATLSTFQNVNKEERMSKPFDMRNRRYELWRNSVRQRHLEPRLTFEEWWGIWQPHWERREIDQLVMARIGDRGHYEVGNVYITTNGQNVADAAIHRALKNWPREVETIQLRGERP